ncbi:hypothetical protein CEW46_21500 [Bacillus cereus]|nr:hypothetical protein CEW46_21500 [Bacillus cereus]
MKITELEWIYKNKSKLSEDEVKQLNSYDFFNQYGSGELNQNALKMVELFGVATGIYQKYN